MEDKLQACIARLRAMQASGKLSRGEWELLEEVIEELGAAHRQVQRLRKSSQRQVWRVITDVTGRVAWKALLWYLGIDDGTHQS